MKFTINKSDIIDVLAKIQGLTGRRSSLAITECVRIHSAESMIHLTATDLETGFEGSFPAVVETEGTIAISARKLYEIVREFPSSEILIDEGENRRVHIGNQKVQYHLMGMNPDDFPDTPTLGEIDFFSLDADAFKRMIDKSIIISGIGEDKKPHINGILFERRSDETPPLLRMVSTDGSRLSKFDLLIADETALPAGEGVLVPKKGLHEVSKFLGGGTVQIGIKESYFVVRGKAETLYIRMLEGQFPRYEEIVMREEGDQIKVEKEAFLNMLKRMSILCTDSYRAAIFEFKDDTLVINATNPDIGDSKEDMAIEFKNRKFEAAFNPKFFIDAVGCIDDDHLILNLLSEDKPCLIDGVEDKSYLSAIMPMRV